MQKLNINIFINIYIYMLTNNKRCIIIEETNNCIIKICMFGKTGIQQKIINKHYFEQCKKPIHIIYVK